MEVNNRFSTNCRFNQAVHYEGDRFVVIFISSYCSICKEFAYVALVGVVEPLVSGFLVR